MHRESVACYILCRKPVRGREKALGNRLRLQVEATAGQVTSWVWVEHVEHAGHGLRAIRAKIVCRLQKAFAQVEGKSRMRGQIYIRI